MLERRRQIVREGFGRQSTTAGFDGHGLPVLGGEGDFQGESH